MAPPRSYNFGVEIELIAKLLKTRHRFLDFIGLMERSHWFEKLAASLRCLDAKAVADRLDERYRKHPEHYDKWWITKDGSLGDPPFPQIPLEAVSPIFCTKGDWKADIELFWYAWHQVFAVPDSSSLCGSHIHISPSHGNGFNISQLRLIAFGVVLYEPLIKRLLPYHRRDNEYCKGNRKYSRKLRKLADGDHDVWTLWPVMNALGNIDDREELRYFMQGHSEPRYDRHVLWNFGNILPGQSGTIEFRGGPGLVDPASTKMWISFVVAFVHLCLRQRLNKWYRFPKPTMTRFWRSLRKAAHSMGVNENLPDGWEAMAE